MEAISIINNTQILGYSINVYGTFENPIFLAKDVAEWIEHTNSRMMVQSVDENERVVNNVYTPGGNQEQWFLTEDGLYEVLMQSRKPIAKEFKKQVKQYLKDLRTKGFTATTPKLDELVNNPDLLITLATQLKTERAEKLRLQEQTLLQAKELKESAPKVVYYDQVLQSETLYPITLIAKDLGMSGKALNEKLHKLGVIYSLHGTWVLYDKYQNLGYTHTKTHTYTDSKGEIRTSVQTYWTEKGRKFIFELLKPQKVKVA